jgi:phage baseplate assembly protein W
MSTYGLAPKLPLVYTEGTGPYVMMREYGELIQQNMKMLVLTSPGERIMIPEYGVGLRRYIFEPDVSPLREEIRSRIIDQIGRFMPGVILEQVQVLSAEDRPELPDNYLRINIFYYSPALNKSFRLQFDGDRIQKTVKIS